MFDIHLLDLTVLIGYLVGITGLGVWMGRRVKNSADFFMPRRFGKAMMAMHAFGSGTASDQAVGVVSATSRSGLAGIWYQWLWLFSTPFYWLVAPIFRRFRAVTTADVLLLRFDRSVAILFAVVGIAAMSTKIGLILKGAGALTAGAIVAEAPVDPGAAADEDAEQTDSQQQRQLVSNVTIVLIAVMFLIYGAAGGLGAAIVTDFIQGILTVLFSFILLPFVLYAVGGMSGVAETITDRSMLSLVAPGEIGVFFIVMMSVQALTGIIAQPHVMGVCSAGKTEYEGRYGFMVGNFLKRLCTIAWCLTAIAAVAWYLQRGTPMSTISDANFGDAIYGDVARHFLPQAMPGLLGIFLATLLAAVMSSCDSFMISSSGLFTENIYRPFMPGKSPAHYVWVGRAFALVIVAGGLAFAYATKDVVDALEIWFRIAPMTGIVLWMSFFWRRMTVAGAWAATLSGFAAWWVTTQPWCIQAVADLPIADSWTLIHVDGTQPEIYEPWGITLRLAVAVIAGVAVSLITPKVDEQRLDRFYLLMRTPVQPNERVTEPCTLPENITTPPRKMLISKWNLEVPLPSVTSVVGFTIGWALVGVLIGGFIWFVEMTT